jgi:glutaredoxin
MHTGLALSLIAILLAYIFYMKSNMQGDAAPSPSPPAGSVPAFSAIELFVSDKCSHCNAMKSEINKLVEQAQKENISVRIVIPEDPDAEAMMTSRNVQYFPAIFVRGKPFETDRTALCILKQYRSGLA